MSEQRHLFDMAPRFDAPEWTVRLLTSPETYRNWIPQYHYSGSVGSVNGDFYGVFAPDLVCIVAVGFTANEHGLSKRYDLGHLPGNREITRVAAHPDAPKNTPSRAVAMTCHLHAQTTGDQWMFSYADTGQNHHGGIYQALNAVYVGLSPSRPGYLVDGVPMHPRAVVHRWGSESEATRLAVAEREGITIERVEGMNAPKHTYILPIGPKSKRREVVKALRHHSKPYPKRDTCHRYNASTAGGDDV